MLLKKLSLAVATALVFASPVFAAPSAVQVSQHYANLVEANYQDVLTRVKALQTAIDAFVAAPSAEGLEQAKQAWLAAREPYGQTEAFRFYAGPIDDAKGPEGQINAWPLDESYIDYVKGNSKAGIINKPNVAITKQKLASLNEKGGEENVSTGFHAIEFLLWGQDFNKEGPGNRSYTDFVDGQAPNADRRRTYLKTVTELLVDDVQYLVEAWQPNAKNYRARFEKDPQAVRKMLVGMGVLSRAELAGERMEVALASRDQEDEHSCFSDNTHRDIVTNAEGIRNVWLGQYKRIDGTDIKGPSLQELVQASNPQAAEKLSRDLEATLAAVNAIQAPFDREIAETEGRRRVQKAVQLLRKQSDSMVEAAKAIGIQRLNVKG